MRATFDVLAEQIPIRRTEIPSGTRIFDWIVPDEWNLRDAYVADADGTRVIDYRHSTLHVVSYSEPVRTRLTLDELRERLHTLPDQPDLIPYRTSYYERTWGFCLSHRRLLELAPGDYEVVIDSTLEPGHLTYAELAIQGAGEERGADLDLRLPSLARERQPLGHRGRHYARQAAARTPPAPHLPLPVRPRHDRPPRLAAPKPRPVWTASGTGLTLSCIGDGGGLTYKRSRQGDAEVDRAMETVLRDSGIRHRVLPWEPWGGDERQFCSPGFDLPVGSLMRTPHGEFAGYHTSADGLERIRRESLAEAVDRCLGLVDVLESNRRYANLSPYGEPQLGRRGLYRAAGGAVDTPADERALLWVLNQSDGRCDLLDIARGSRLTYPVIRRAAERLEDAGLLAAA